MLASRTCMFRTLHTCPLCLTHLTKIVSLIRPAVVLESLTASTTSWNLVRFADFYGLRTGESLTSLISPPRHRQEAEGSSVAHAERLAKLATFQLQMLRHAMKCMFLPFFVIVLPSSGVDFDELSELTLARVVPRIEKIVYSTCSIHPEENEQVVAAALRSTEAIAGGFGLAPRSAVLPEWPRRGQPGNLDDAGWLSWPIWPPHGAR